MSVTVRPRTVNGFSGSFTRRGTLESAGDCEANAEQEAFLGCRILASGYVSDQVDLACRLGLKKTRRPCVEELLAHAFRTWGHNFPAHVTGRYAAAIWDRSEGRGLITHDALGLAPLFYRQQCDSLLFSTHLQDLVDNSSDFILDSEYLADFLAFGGISTDRTPYDKIRRVLPGRSLWWSAGKLRGVQSWNLADCPRVSCADDAEYEERFRSLLDAGVRSARASEGPAWISLSGGLDSSSIASVAATADPHGLAAYSVICPGWPDADEQKWMQSVVDCYKLPWHKVDMEDILPFAALPARCYAEPTPAVITEKTLDVEEQLLGSHGVRVMLTGCGGDDVLCASAGSVPVHLADALFDGAPVAALGAIRRWRSETTGSRSYVYWVIQSLLRPAINHLRRLPIRDAASASLPPWISCEYAEKLKVVQRSRRQLATRCRHPGRQMVADSLWALSLAMASLHQRQANFEVRAPLLYRPLVEFMSGIPWEQKLRARCDRYLQRRALKNVLPELVRRRGGKISGSRALVEGLRRSPDWVDFLCDDPKIAEFGIVDADEWRRAVKRACVGQTGDDRMFTTAVAIEAWLKQSGERCRRELSVSNREVS